jgi:hypothetical protein
MANEMKQLEFIRWLLPVALRVIGKQHGYLIQWALAKSGRECGWNKNNVLIARANNCLGIKAASSTTPHIVLQDSLADGRNDGVVRWRRAVLLD